MTHGERVQPLQSVKLIYQSCSRSRVAWTSFLLDGSSSVGRLGWNPSIGLLGWDPGVVLGWDSSVGYSGSPR